MFGKNTYFLPYPRPVDSVIDFNGVEILLHNPNFQPQQYIVDHHQDRSAFVPPRRSSGKKDRHSKIYTSQGPRDRRVRLSIGIARKFFDLQEMLGVDKPSKTLDWLLTKSKSAIKELVQKKQKKGESCRDSNEDGEGQEEEEEEGEEESRKKKSTNNNTIAKESRAKARARARERTREKMCIKNMNAASGINQLQFLQLFGGGSSSSNPNPSVDLIHHEGVARDLNYSVNEWGNFTSHASFLEHHKFITNQ